MVAVSDNTTPTSARSSAGAVVDVLVTGDVAPTIETNATTRGSGRTALIAPPVSGAAAFHVSDRVPAVETYPVDIAITTYLASIGRATPRGMAISLRNDRLPSSIDEQAYLRAPMPHHDDDNGLTTLNGEDAEKMRPRKAMTMTRKTKSEVDFK